MAAAGLWTTPSDLARVGIELQRALKGEPGRILSPDTARQMLTPQVEDVGIGFFLSGKGEAIRFGHGGWDEGFVARMTVYAHLGVGAVIMVNSNQGAEMLGEIERAIARAYDWPGYFPEEKTIPASAEALDACVGDYVAASGLHFIVTRTEDALFLQPAGQPPIELYPESETKFFMRVVNAEVTFEKGEAGEVKGLTLHQEGRQVAAEKRR